MLDLLVTPPAQGGLGPYGPLDHGPGVIRRAEHQPGALRALIAPGVVIADEPVSETGLGQVCRPAAG